MNVVSIVATEIATSLPRFGLEVSGFEAHHIATVYVSRRPKMPARQLADSLLNLPGLKWQSQDEQGIRRLVMLSLIEHLDGMYYVETFEHDGVSEQ
jgi:hypothetical protein